MEYVSAIVPPLVMAIGFAFLVRAIIRSQGGAQKAKEDAAAEAMAAGSSTE
ncbi:hypothetical protein [Kitasatospora sp. NPDC057198]|uniref:hypothetical protein n=1 Tax=Kitasatospora sp. NPDC057198 TaxID=3346046 RepID=UPI003627A76D